MCPHFACNLLLVHVPNNNSDLGWLQVKAKYDTVAQMWDSLPTNAELLQRQGLTEEEEMVSVCVWQGIQSTTSLVDFSLPFSLVRSRFIVLIAVPAILKQSPLAAPPVLVMQHSVNASKSLLTSF